MDRGSELSKIRHSAAHVLAAAVLRLFPNAKLDIGPATEAGFYYDFDLDHKFSQQDLEKIEAEMRKIIAENQQFTRKIVSREEAMAMMKLRNQPYKLERLADIPEGEEISLYSNGEFVDLCRGEHINSTGEIGAIKLLGIAGAYYRGSEKNKQLQRISGTAFASQGELDEYLNALEEAKKRDHRKLGKELKLFLISDEVGQGMILWLPRGAIIRKELQNFILEELEKHGYQQVFTPHIAKLGLFRTSGHFPYYKESQFAPLPDRLTLEKNISAGQSCEEMFSALEAGQAEGFLLKPMNCPGHIVIYMAEPRSYRDLPLKLAEFGTVYRWEQSGELSGMTRVRSFTQDDAHIFCTEQQLRDEISGCLSLVKVIFKTLGMEKFRVRIGLRAKNSDKYIGSDANWAAAEEVLRSAAGELEVPFEENEGEAAFYGPKIDFVVQDVIGREWQLGTVQVDYNLPERFNMSYIGPDNREHRPIMIHRAPFGSLERFVGLLIEHFGGDFPTWLAPEQVRIIPLGDSLVGYANTVCGELKAHGIRCSTDSSSDKLNAKIRRAEVEKIPHMFVLGPREADTSSVSIRSRVDKSFTGTLQLQDAIMHLRKLIDSRKLSHLAMSSCEII
ncbi:MAG: threonine--tRNA ligase [Puniceicoccales bacterium]|jgi:threonyl-tRNA synthetase|nr:threonine--tRNA ligase [Puniceicoccales bacterium]